MNKQKLRGIKRSLQTSPADYADLSEVLSVIDALLEDGPEEQSLHGVKPGLVLFRPHDAQEWQHGWLTHESNVYDRDGTSFAVDDCEIRPANAPPEPEPQRERQFPPKGMPILIRTMEDRPWLSAVSIGGGYAIREIKIEETFTTPGSFNLSMFDWRYLPAPAPWPEDAECWIGTSFGEYTFSIFRYSDGDRLPEGHVIHVQHREDT